MPVNTLLTLDSPAGTHGKEVVLPWAEGNNTPLALTDVLSTYAGEGGDAAAYPLTIQSTHPFDRRQAQPAHQVALSQAYLDDVMLEAWLGVTWHRGEATFYAEVDLGSTFVIHATRVTLQVLTFWNAAAVEVPRTTSISVSRGDHTGGKACGATWTSPRCAFTPNPSAEGVNLRVPPFARAVRIFSSSGAAYAITDAERDSEQTGTRAFQTSTFLAMPGEECPLPSHRGTIRLFPQLGTGVYLDDQGANEVEYMRAQFLLDL